MVSEAYTTGTSLSKNATVADEAAANTRSKRCPATRAAVWAPKRRATARACRWRYERRNAESERRAAARRESSLHDRYGPSATTSAPAARRDRIMKNGVPDHVRRSAGSPMVANATRMGLLDSSETRALPSLMSLLTSSRRSRMRRAAHQPRSRERSTAPPSPGRCPLGGNGPIVGRVCRSVGYLPGERFSMGARPAMATSIEDGSPAARPPGEPRRRGSAIAGFRWVSSARMTLQLVRLGVQVVLARLLAPADFGMMAVAFVVLGLFDVIQDMGTGRAIIVQPQLNRGLFDSVFVDQPVPRARDGPRPRPRGAPHRRDVRPWRGRRPAVDAALACAERRDLLRRQRPARRADALDVLRAARR